MSQRLILPFKQHTLISAGYKNTAYLNYYSYQHYGMDMGCQESGYTVYGCGDGVVYAAGLNNGSPYKGIGYCVVIQYPEVECNDGKIRNLACRMFHFDKLYVKAGDKVTVNTKIGEYGNTGKTYQGNKKGAHLHIEFGTNYTSPSYAIGIASVSSGTVVKRTTSDISLDPSSVWFLGKGQSISGVTAGWYLSKDVNLSSVSSIKKEVVDTKAQKLILPINKCKLTASKGTSAYRSRFGFEHYGVDMISLAGDRTVWGSGIGVVLACGNDSLFGNTVIVKYTNVYNHKTGKTQDVIFRYFHGAKILCKKGDKVTKDTRLMMYGDTGKYNVGAHLHISADYDTKYYQYEPGISVSGTIIKKGTASTMLNPMDVLHCKVSAPDNQFITRSADQYTIATDTNIPKIQ